MAGHLKEGALAAALVCVTAVAAGAAAPPRTGEEAALAEGSLPELGPEPTLHDYLRYAAAANPGLEAARRRWQADAEEGARARALPEPQLSFSRVVRPAASGDGPREQRLALSQGFPWFGTLAARGAAADAGAAAAGREYEQARLELAFRVKTAYAEYYYLGRALAIARDHVELVAHLEAVARTRYRSGSATHSAVVQAQVELGRLEDQRRGLEAQRAPAMARLNAALDRAPAAALPWPGSLEVPEAPFTDAEAMDRLAQGNADLGRLDWLARERQQGVRLARKAYYPELMLGVEYTANPASMAGGSRDPVMAMATVSLPIWRGSYRAAERQARLQGAAVQAERAEASRRLQAALSQALYALREGERQTSLYRDTLLPVAEESLEVTRRGFEAGEVDFLSLIDAERLLLEFRLARERALADRAAALAEVEMLVNGDLWEGSGSTSPRPGAEGAER